MTKFKGTKGKWHIHSENEERKWINVESKKGIMLRSFYGDEPRIIKQKEAKANALLISKAPEMLEMLDEVSDIFETLNLDSRIYKRLKKLIKEATEL